MISAAQLKGTKGPIGRPWKFQSETGTPCVCVNWSQAHYLACSRLNLPSESTPFVDYCSHLLDGEKKSRYSLIIPSRCGSQPIFCSLLSCFLLEVVFSKRVSLHLEEFSGLLLHNEWTFQKSGMEHPLPDLHLFYNIWIYFSKKEDVLSYMRPYLNVIRYHHKRY